MTRQKLRSFEAEDERTLREALEEIYGTSIDVEEAQLAAEAWGLGVQYQTGNLEPLESVVRSKLVGCGFADDVIFERDKNEIQILCMGFKSRFFRGDEKKAAVAR